MKFTSLAALLSALVLPAAALAQTAPTEAQVAAITEMLAGMQCEMDPDDIEVEDGTFDLDDVYCADGQYDIKLDADLNVTNKRKE